MGKLYIVPTPIGNMGDMTFRAVEILQNVSLILAEDTRQTSKLLKHYEIDVPMRSYHQHNEHKIADQLLIEVATQDVALVSDAGTPGISDPGYLLVRACLDVGLEVECLPGATAFVPALVMSGLPASSFYFEGFLPHKKGRQKKLKELCELDRTIILYESPYRIVKLLGELETHFGAERQISVSREISKKFEETIRGSVLDLKSHFESHEPKGEFVVVIDGVS